MLIPQRNKKKNKSERKRPTRTCSASRTVIEKVQIGGFGKRRWKKKGRKKIKRKQRRISEQENQLLKGKMKRKDHKNKMFTRE